MSLSLPPLPLLLLLLLLLYGGGSGSDLMVLSRLGLDSIHNKMIMSK
jgi:hypothetical protein